MKNAIRTYILIALCCCLWMTVPANAQSVRAERRDIKAGNELYREGKYAESIQKYKAALEVNPSSDVARFNMGLGKIRMAEKSQNDSVKQKLMSEGAEDLGKVAQLGMQKADLSAKANYNLGNLSFGKEDYAGAIQLYKQALRLNPKFNEARRNLRIAQLRLQNQQDDKNKDQQDQQDKQDQQQDKQDQKQDQQKDQDQQQQNQDQQPPQPKENEISKQAADQILNAVENNEAATRARKGNNEKGEKASGVSGTLRKW